jgi:hypothetical protein
MRPTERESAHPPSGVRVREKKGGGGGHEFAVGEEVALAGVEAELE